MLKNREIITGISVFLGMLLAVLYVTANLVFCLIYNSVWYLALALYNGLIMISRYYAFDLYKKGDVVAKISASLSVATVFMAAAIIYSTVSDDFRLRSGVSLLVTLLFCAYTLIRIVLSLFERRKGALFFLVEKLRFLSFFTSLHSLNLAIIHLDAIRMEDRAVFSFVSAFFSSYLLLATVKFGKND